MAGPPSYDSGAAGDQRRKRKRTGNPRARLGNPCDLVETGELDSGISGDAVERNIGLVVNAGEGGVTSDKKKLHAIGNDPCREARDFADIAELLRANPGKISREELQQLSRQFAPAEFETKLLTLL